MHPSRASSIILGLSDPHTPNELMQQQEIKGVNISVLRLPRATSWTERITTANEWLNSFNPDWVSLQFVSYAFHPKGLVHGLARKMAPLLAGRRLHIMFHEIWLCREQGWGWKKSAVG